MRCVGITRPGAVGVEVADLSADGETVSVIATLSEFWNDPAAHLEGAARGPVINRADVVLTPPVRPDARVLCVGLNYVDHANEGSYRAQPLPIQPTLFARWPVTLTTDGDEIPVPPGEDGLDWEGEVMAWVGRPLFQATPEDALAAVIGYSTFNDLTARRAQKMSSQWTLGKNADRSGPLGPMIPAGNVGDLRAGLHISTRVNGATVQAACTSAMVHSVGDTLAYISHTISLQPGDLLATGTPAGVGYARTPPWLLQPGDVVEVEVERLGVLRNTITAHRPQPVRGRGRS